MPVLYSLLIACTARMATTAWPSMIPVRLILTVSTGQARPAGQVTAAADITLTVTVSAMVAASSQNVAAAVRSFVHSACSACLMQAWLMRPSGAAG